MIEIPSLTEKLEALTFGTGYPLTQENGQRKYGPPRDWVGPPPPRGCEVFIGKLPRELFEDELVPVFSRMGTIYELRMMLNFSGSNRGYAFLNYSSRVEAMAAIKNLHNFEIRPGHRIGVVRSVDNCHLYIGGIPRNKSEREIASEMSQYVAGIVKVIVQKDSFDSNLNRGFALVEFVSHRAAAMARRSLVPGYAKLWNKEVEVEWAEMQDINKDFENIKRKVYKYSVNQDKTQKTITRDNLLIFGSPVLKLDKICQKNKWPSPKYNCRKYSKTDGSEIWICRVEFSELASAYLPKFLSMQCSSLAEAEYSAASSCLSYIQQHEHLLLQYSDQNKSLLNSASYQQPLFSQIHQHIPLNMW